MLILIKNNFYFCNLLCITGRFTILVEKSDLICGSFRSSRNRQIIIILILNQVSIFPNRGNLINQFCLCKSARRNLDGNCPVRLISIYNTSLRQLRLIFIPRSYRSLLGSAGMALVIFCFILYFFICNNIRYIHLGVIGDCIGILPSVPCRDRICPTALSIICRQLIPRNCSRFFRSIFLCYVNLNPIPGIFHVRTGRFDLINNLIFCDRYITIFVIFNLPWNNTIIFGLPVFRCFRYYITNRCINVFLNGCICRNSMMKLLCLRLFILIRLNRHRISSFFFRISVLICLKFRKIYRCSIGKRHRFSILH